MKTATKVVIGVIAGGLLLGVATCGGFAWWIDANKGDLAAMGEEQRAAGEAFGVTTEQLGCIDEALGRQDDCGGFDPMCEAQNGMWLKACLDVATESPGLCEDVPPRTEIIESATWAVGTCANLGRPQDQPCGRLLQQVQEHCHGPL